MIITFIVLLIIISLIVLVGIRFNLSLYKRGSIPVELRCMYMKKKYEDDSTPLHDMIFQHN